MNFTFREAIFLLIMWLWVNVCFAATDYTALSNNLAALPDLQSSTQGYDLLGGKVVQNVPLVKGQIPFSMQYHASLRLSSDGGVDYYQELDEGGVADWSNEYSGYILTNITPGTNGERAFIIKLPQSSDKLIVAYMAGKWKRIYYSGSGAAPAQTFTSEDMRDIIFSESNGVITIIKDGITYIANISKTFDSFGKSDKLLKFTSIKFQDGRQLTLSYDSGVNLIEVRDNRNNILKILREYKKAGSQSQSALERKLITGVEYLSGSNSQKSTISYQETQVASIVDPSKQETRYTITSINTPFSGKISYNYGNQLRGYLYKYIFNNVANRTQAQIVSYVTYPMLTKVLDEQNNSLREWDYANIVDWNNNTNDFYVYATQITASSTVGNGTFNKTISYYDDLRGPFSSRFVIKGQQQAVDTTIDSSKLGSYVNEADLVTMKSATVTITMTGDYPSLKSGSIPIRSVTFNPFTHRIVSIKDFNGNTTKYEYDNLNRLTKKTEALDNIDSQVTTYSYTTLSNGAVNKYTIPNEIVTDSQKVTNTIDQNGWITQQVISYPKGGLSKTITYTYYTDPMKADFGLLKSIDAPRTDVDDSIAMTYDNFGNKSTMTQNVNNKMIVTKYLNYDSFAQPERVIYPSGLVDQYIYNSDGTLKSKIIGKGGETGNITGGAVTSYTYDYLKRKRSETNPDNEVTTYDYDTLGQLIKTTLPDGSIINQNYFDNGVARTTEGASITYNEIDNQGRISKSGQGNATDYYWKSFSYDANGNLTQTKSALGIIEKWAYDALNRNISYTDGDGKLSTKSYDKTNNLISAKDAINAGSSPFNYVSSTLIKDEMNSDYATKSYTYNQADQVTTKIHGSRTCNYSNIDSLGRMGGISCSNENGTDSSYVYNYQYSYDTSGFGHLDQVSSNASYGVDTQYTYDNFDHIINKKQTNKALTAWGGVNAPLTVGYRYSVAGKVTSMTLPSGRVINYNYEGTKGRLSSINIAGNPFISGIFYDSTGQMKSWNIENTAAKYSIEYDSAKNGAIKTVSFVNKNNVALYTEEYGFDKDGRAITINKLGNKNISYAYSNTNRLTAETMKLGSAMQTGWDYGYDANGNLITKNFSQNGVSNVNMTTYAISTGSNKLINKVGTKGILGTVTANYLSTGELRFPPFLSS